MSERRGENARGTGSTGEAHARCARALASLDCPSRTYHPNPPLPYHASTSHRNPLFKSATRARVATLVAQQDAARRCLRSCHRTTTAVAAAGKKAPSEASQAWSPTGPTNPFGKNGAAFPETLICPQTHFCAHARACFSERVETRKVALLTYYSAAGGGGPPTSADWAAGGGRPTADRGFRGRALAPTPTRAAPIRHARRAGRTSPTASPLPSRPAAPPRYPAVDLDCGEAAAGIGGGGDRGVATHMALRATRWTLARCLLPRSSCRVLRMLACNETHAVAQSPAAPKTRYTTGMCYPQPNVKSRSAHRRADPVPPPSPTLDWGGLRVLTGAPSTNTAHRPSPPGCPSREAGLRTFRRLSMRGARRRMARVSRSLTGNDRGGDGGGGGGAGPRIEKKEGRPQRRSWRKLAASPIHRV
eukprot:364977-Chlamydomonas_euryale.AAC.2